MVAWMGKFVQNSSQSGWLDGKFPGKWDELSSQIQTIRFPVLGQVAPSAMGNSTSAQTVPQALKNLLKAKGIGLKKDTVENFLKAVDQVAPWFPVTGHLTMPNWEKLGKDLRFAEEQGVLSKRVMQVWKLVKNCIGDEERCGAELKKGNEAISQVRQESSQKSETKGTSRQGDMSQDDLESIADSLEKVKLKVEPSALGLPHPLPYDPGGAEGRCLHPETWRELRAQCFPVFQDAQGNRTHEPLDWKIVQRLAEGVCAYGVTAAYVVVQLESLHPFV